MTMLLLALGLSAQLTVSVRVQGAAQVNVSPIGDTTVAVKGTPQAYQVSQSTVTWQGQVYQVVTVIF